MFYQPCPIIVITFRVLRIEIILFRILIYNTLKLLLEVVYGLILYVQENLSTQPQPSPPPDHSIFEKYQDQHRDN